MKTTNTKQKIAETAIGAAIGAAIAGPAGAVVGGLVGHEAASHASAVGEGESVTKEAPDDSDDPIVHAQVRRILVPVDFSQPSQRALRFAREWAARFGSEVCLLHVLEPIPAMATFPDMGIAPPVPLPDFHDKARVGLERLAQQVFSDSVKTSVHLRDGVAYDEISVAARELDADLIIISTHGRTGLMHALMGSTAERVVRHAPCPVLTLRRAANR
jgi:universal stress protein A